MSSLSRIVDALYIRLQVKDVDRILEIEEGLNLDLDNLRNLGETEEGFTGQANSGSLPLIL